MPVPLVYSKGSETAGMNVEFFDLANGTGYTSFYGYNTNSSGAITLGLINTTLRTYTALTYDYAPQDFSVVFNKTQIIKGKAIVQLNWGFKGDGSTSTWYASCALLKNSTVLASARGDNMSGTGETSRIEVIPLNISSTAITPDDTLTLRVNLTAVSDTGTTNYWITHDPLGATLTPLGWTASISTTQLKAYIPFKIDI